jgi:hypothetical protein
MNIPFKTIGLIVIFLLIGMGIGYSVVPIKTEIQTITKTKTIEKPGITATETTTATIQRRSTVTNTVTEFSTITSTVTVSENETTTTQFPKVWTTVLTFEGTNDTITEDFNVSVLSWRINYTVEAGQSPLFLFFLYRAGEKTAYKEMVKYHQSGTEVVYIKGIPGDFYLRIEAANVKWTIEIQVEK